MALEQQDYLVGSTVVLTVGVSKRSTRIPTNAVTLVLDALFLVPSGGAAVPVTVAGSNAFTNITEGAYEFRLDTTGYLPGTYTWRAKATDGTVPGVAVQEDSFVLKAVTS